jgi:Glu-tRNA(Gln) amidotransferase subunit E-like FAD-binding protein
MTLKKDSSFMIDLIVKNEIYKNKNIDEIQEDIRSKMTKNFTTDNFDLERLFFNTFEIINAEVKFTDKILFQFSKVTLETFIVSLIPAQ